MYTTLRITQLFFSSAQTYMVRMISLTPSFDVHMLRLSALCIMTMRTLGGDSELG